MASTAATLAFALVLACAGVAGLRRPPPKDASRLGTAGSFVLEETNVTCRTFPDAVSPNVLEQCDELSRPDPVEGDAVTQPAAVQSLLCMAYAGTAKALCERRVDPASLTTKDGPIDGLCASIIADLRKIRLGSGYDNYVERLAKSLPADPNGCSLVCTTMAGNQSSLCSKTKLFLNRLSSDSRAPNETETSSKRAPSRTQSVEDAPKRADERTQRPIVPAKALVAARAKAPVIENATASSIPPKSSIAKTPTPEPVDRAPSKEVGDEYLKNPARLRSPDEKSKSDVQNPASQALPDVDNKNYVQNKAPPMGADVDNKKYVENSAPQMRTEDNKKYVEISAPQMRPDDNKKYAEISAPQMRPDDDGNRDVDNPSQSMRDDDKEVENAGMPPNIVEKEYADESDGNEDINQIEGQPISTAEKTPKASVTANQDMNKKTESSEDNGSSYAKFADNSDPSDSNFFLYFLFIVGTFILGYVMFHNKKKCLGLLLEGRRGNNMTRRRGSGAAYRKLDCTLEEAVSSTPPSHGPHIVY